MNEKCPQCGGEMERMDIDGIDSWSCPKDAYAYAVDQDALDDDEESWSSWAVTL